MTKRSAKDLANELEDLIAHDLSLKVVEKYEETMLSMIDTLHESNVPPSLAMKVIAATVAIILENTAASFAASLATMTDGADDVYFDEDHGRRGAAALREDFARSYSTGVEKGLRKSKKLCAAYEDVDLEGAEADVKDLFARVKAKK
jgi:hypothetical protein